MNEIQTELSLRAVSRGLPRLVAQENRRKTEPKEIPSWETGRIRGKHRKTWKKRENQGETQKNTEKQGESGGNIEKHVKTGRIRGKHRKTWGNKGNIGKTGEYMETHGNFYIYWGHNMESYMRY